MQFKNLNFFQICNAHLSRKLTIGNCYGANLLHHRRCFYTGKDLFASIKNTDQEHNDRQKLPLHNINVLDLTRVLAGPFCSQNLADLGANVIKVEHIHTGDDTREWGPPYFYNKNADTETNSEESVDCSAYFATCNRSKKSIALDLKTKEGKEIIFDLVTHSNVFMENFSTGVTERLGIDYSSLEKVNPNLIYASISGFGRTGTYRNRPGYDFLIQGMSGIMDLTGEPEREPQKIGMAFVDVLTGMYTTQAILASLLAKKGQHIDVSLFDSALTALVNQAQNFLATNVSPSRKGNMHPNIAPYALFHCSDGPIIITIGNDHQFRKFSNLIQISEEYLPLFKTNELRLSNRNLLTEIINEKLKVHKRSYWIELLNELNVPCGPVNTVKEAFEEIATKERGMIWGFPESNIRTIGSPIKFSKTKIENKDATPPPKLGQHTDEILKDILGYSKEKIENLRNKAVIC